MLEKLMEELGYDKHTTKKYYDEKLSVDELTLKTHKIGSSIDRMVFDRIHGEVSIHERSTAMLHTNIVSLKAEEIELLYYQAKALGWFDE